MKCSRCQNEVNWKLMYPLADGTQVCNTCWYSRTDHEEKTVEVDGKKLVVCFAFWSEK